MMPGVFMNKTTHTIIVIVATAAVIFTLEGLWLHIHPSNPQRTVKKIQKPLAAQPAADAQQAARDFFTAMKDSKWDDVAKFWPSNAPKGKQFADIFNDKVKGMIGGLEIVSIGTPYKESGNGWTMVPYEVQFKGGDSQTNSLRIQKQSDGQWIWGGGF